MLLALPKGSRGQQGSIEIHAADNPQIELSESIKPESGRYRPSTQSDPQGLVGVLREVLPIGDVSGSPAFQQNIGCQGDEEVQALEWPQDKGESISQELGVKMPLSICTLATRNGR